MPVDAADSAKCYCLRCDFVMCAKSCFLNGEEKNLFHFPEIAPQFFIVHRLASFRKFVHRVYYTKFN